VEIQISIDSAHGGAKSRSFRAMYLASIEADPLWSGGLADTNNIRPVWAMFAGTEQPLRAFSANLSKGQKAQYSNGSSYRRGNMTRIEILRSAYYVNAWQREAEGSILTMFLPELFRMDPGMVSQDGASFILAPYKQWVEDQSIPDKAQILEYGKQFVPEDTWMTGETLERLVPMSFLFGAYLDRRTRCPLVADGRFYFQLLLACLEKGLASFALHDRSRSYNKFGYHNSFRFYALGTPDIGLELPIAFKASHEDLEAMLSQQVDIYFRKVGS